MEDFNDPTVQQWVRATADYTIETLSQLPERNAFLDRMKELDASVPTQVYGILQLANGNIFYLKIEPQDDVAKLYRKDNIHSTEKYHNSQTYLHRLGTELEQDEVILKHGIAPLVNVPSMVAPIILHISDSGYAIAQFQYGTQRNIGIHISKLTTLTQNLPEWIKVCDPTDEIRDFVTHDNDLYLLTAKNAPHFKIIKTSLTKPDPSTAETLLAQSNSIVKDMFAANDALYAIATQNGIGKLIRINYDGKIE
jgi:prolyl oligopeptidase